MIILLFYNVVIGLSIIWIYWYINTLIQFWVLKGINWL